MKLPKQFSQRARTIFLIVHLWTGLALGLWLILIGLTGSVLAWRSEFTGWEARQRVGARMPAPGEKIIPLSRAIAALKAADPKLTPERGMYLPPKEYGYYLYNARGERNGERVALIYLVDPVSAKVYPPVRRDTMWLQTFEHLHADLIAGARGAVANGILSFFTLFLLLSGLWLWWPSNLKQLKARLTIKRGVSLRRTLYDVHNALGIYLFALLFVLTLTAVLLILNSQTNDGVERAIDRVAGAKKPAVTRGSETVSGGQMPDLEARGAPIPLDEMVERAKAAVPGGTLLFVAAPRRPGQPFQTAFDPISFNNGLVLFDPYSGKRLEANGRTFTPGQLTMKAVGDLHYGWFGGNWSKFFYSLSGVLPLGLFISGTWMWINKKRSQKRLIKKRRVAKEETVTV